MQEPQSLLCQKRVIEHGEITKHTTNCFLFCQILPLHPMNLSSITLLSPPKLLNKGLNLIAQTYRQFKASHCVSRDSLDDCL